MHEPWVGSLNRGQPMRMGVYKAKRVEPCGITNREGCMRLWAVVFCVSATVWGGWAEAQTADVIKGASPS